MFKACEQALRMQVKDKESMQRSKRLPKQEEDIKLLALHGLCERVLGPTSAAPVQN